MGDIIIQRADGKEYVGCVYNIVADKYGHKKVFIGWAEMPPDYIPEYGYSATNIYNLSSVFKVIKTS